MNVYKPKQQWMPAVWIVAMMCMLASACQDDMLADKAQTVSEQTAYWYTQTRTAEEQEAMLMSHGVGFSLNANTEEAGDMSSVRCQVVDLNALKKAEVYSCNYTGETEISKTVSRSFSEYLQNTYTNASLSGKLPGYTKAEITSASIFEHGMDTIICFTSEHKEKVLDKSIDTDLMKTVFEDNPEQYLSDNFLYALDKLKKSGYDDVAVVDSFINIFGTHVITQASVGGKLKIDIVTGRKNVQTIIEENNIKEESLNLYFKKKSSSIGEEMIKQITTILHNAQIYLNIEGGDLSVFNRLISNPSYDNIDANDKNLEKWQQSISFDENSPWDSRCEMIEMDVFPIWEFIPDEKLSALVESRISANTSAMENIYGNMNFINVEIPVQPETVTTVFAGTPMTIYNPWVTDIVAANRHVATICKEFVPEIDQNNSVFVIYPIYNNKIQTDAGLCVHNGNTFRVKWIYNQFAVQKDTIAVNDPQTVYMHFGYLSTREFDGVSYTTGTKRIGYEWPGSIDINGNIVNREALCTTRKFMGNFYLDNEKQYDNLPNWSYTKTEWNYKYYMDNYPELFNSDKPYELSGIKINGRKGSENTANRMVRNYNYTYYINTSEAEL